MLVSEAVREEAGGVVSVGTDRDADTDYLSDHYPVYLSWRQLQYQEPEEEESHSAA